jgi:protein KTI12
METPNEKQRWDRPLVVVSDPNDRTVLESIVSQCLSKSSKLQTKKATTKAIGSSAQVNDQIDRTINEFTTELLKIQGTLPLGGRVEILGASFVLRKQLTSGQLKRAKREFADRAKSVAEGANIAQLFADSLEVLF